MRSGTLDVHDGFHGLARKIKSLQAKSGYSEAALQREFHAFLEKTHWAGLNIEANRPHRGDLAVAKDRLSEPFFVVELKRDETLKHDHIHQARRYAAMHQCGCVLTNGTEYYYVLAKDQALRFDISGLQVDVTRGEHLIFKLGSVSPSRFDKALEVFLGEIFYYSARDPVMAQHVAGRLRATMGKLLLPAVAPQRPHTKSSPAPAARGKTSTPAESQAVVRYSNARSVAKALARHIGLGQDSIDTDSADRIVVKKGALQLVRVREFQHHCRVTIRSASADWDGRHEWDSDWHDVNDKRSFNKVSLLLRKEWI